MLNEMETFAKRLRQARVKEKISMEALSRLLNGSVSKQAISKYEAAKMMPSSTILIALADALRVDLDYFFRSCTGNESFFSQKSECWKERYRGIKGEYPG